MNRIVNFIRRIITADGKKVLGRWELEQCNKKINKKVDYANEDHCGPCGLSQLETELPKLKDIIKNTTQNK
jgi:hypothetical protein